MKRLLCLVASALMIAGAFFVPGEGRAEAKCPWLNAATAAGILGGEVTMTVSGPMEHVPGQGTYQSKDQVRMDRFDVSCDFTRKADSSNALRIVVETMKDPAKEFAGHLASCGGSTVALKAIGNEAVQCLGKDGSMSGGETVVARVRDRVFVLTVTRPPDPQASASGDALRPDTRNIAEQVAGSLF